MCTFQDMTHDLQHQKPKGHTHYFVSGAGSEYRGVTNDPEMTRFAKSDLGFLHVKLSDVNLEVNITNANSDLLYQTTISK